MNDFLNSTNEEQKNKNNNGNVNSKQEQDFSIQELSKFKKDNPFFNNVKKKELSSQKENIIKTFKVNDFGERSVESNKITVDSKNKVPRPSKNLKVPIPQMPLKKQSSRISVNLVPEDTLNIVKNLLPEKIKIIILFSVILLSIMFLGWGIIAWKQLDIFIKMQNIRREISFKEGEIHRYKIQSSDIVKLHERYKLIDNLLDNHAYWSKFFELLEKYTSPDVYYTSFSVSRVKGSKITLNARAKNIKAVAEQLKILQNAKDFVKQVKINGFSKLSNAQLGTLKRNNDIVSFDIVLVLQDDVFSRVKDINNK